MIAVSVVLATRDRQQIIDVTLPRHSCAWDAVLAALDAGLDVSVLSVACPSPETTGTSATTRSSAHDRSSALDKESTVIGIHGLIVEKTHRLQEGDRVELYRPLLLDPMEQRRRRALKKH